MKKCLVFVPQFGNMLSTTTWLTTHALQTELTQKSIQMAVSGISFPDIAELRSIAATIWYDTMPDTDYLLFIDADMGFMPEMVLDMFLFDEPLVGAIYPQRRLPVSWAGSGNGEAQSERRGNFMRVEGVGMGCTLIHRSVLKTMLERMPEMVDLRLALHPAWSILQAQGAKRLIRCFEKLDLKERGVVSEDLSFCLRWKQCGGQTWAAIGYRISHVGMFDYAGCYLEVTSQQRAQEEAARKQVEMQTLTQGNYPIEPQMLPPQQQISGQPQQIPIPPGNGQDVTGAWGNTPLASSWTRHPPAEAAE